MAFSLAGLLVLFGLCFAVIRVLPGDLGLPGDRGSAGQFGSPAENKGQGERQEPVLGNDSRQFSKARSNVIVLLLDTLRADHLGYHGYQRPTSPVMDALAAENTVFLYCVAPSSWTPSSIASLFTGLYPSAHGMMPPRKRQMAEAKSIALGSGLVTMAEVFRQNGYQTAAVVSNPWLKEIFGYGQGFEKYVYIRERVASFLNEKALQILESFQKERKKPFFLYLHYMDPHSPYRPPVPYSYLFRGPLKSRRYGRRQLREIGLYDGEIRYLDTELGKLFDYLKQQGLYDDTVIALLADHGEQFLEHGRSGHGHDLHNEEVHVPFILKHDGEARVVKTTVSLVDVFPTLLDLVGIIETYETQGYSLISQINRRKIISVLSEVKRYENHKSLVTPRRLKLMVNLPLRAEMVVKDRFIDAGFGLYNVHDDYWEVNPVRKGERLEQLKAEFYDLYDRIRMKGDGSPTRDIEIDKTIMEELRALGYVGGE